MDSSRNFTGLSATGETVRSPKFLPYLAIAAMLLGAIPFIIRSLFALYFPYTINFTEDTILVSALELASGRNPYSPCQLLKIPYVISPYPPIYYIATALLSFLSGPSLTPGRAVSALSTLGVSFVIYRIIRRETGDRLSAIMGGVGYVTLYPVYIWGMLHRVDNLTLFLAVSGLYFATEKDPGRRHLCMAALLFLLSLFTKQNSVMAFIVAAISLWRVDRKKAVLMAGVVALITLTVFGLLVLASDGGYYFCTVTSIIRPLELNRVLTLTPPALIRPSNAVMFAAVITGLVMKRGRCDKWEFYLLATFLLGLSAIGKSGSGPNYFLEMIAALSIAFGIAISRIAARPPPPPGTWIAAVCILFAAMAANNAVNKKRIYSSWRRVSPILKGEFYYPLADIVRGYTRTGDVILTKRVEMATLLGRVPVMNDPRQFGLLAEAGKWDEGKVLEMIRRKSFPIIITDKDGASLMESEYFSRNVKEEILRNYVYAGGANGAFIYLPRRVGDGWEADRMTERNNSPLNAPGSTGQIANAPMEEIKN